MQPRCGSFRELSLKALSDRHLQEALKGIESRLAAARNAAFRQLENGEELRERAHNIKKHTLDRLDEYLDYLEKKVTALGGKVHWAADAETARKTICELSERGGIQKVVKGKSMVTEEIGLNESLEVRGIEVSETDLGEFVIQLANEPPSHIVGPAIHRPKQEIARLFSEKLGADYMDDPREMTMYVRKVLRRKFLDADMGITGVNFAVAETGTIILFENEGNIRLTTTIPRIHVAVMGIEKVVPTMNDAGILMQLLARSCTGQKLPSYVSMISGPRGRGEYEGAEEFHLVIIDNGRTAVLEDNEMREVLYCIRCGACLNVCPVYLKVGGHAYGWVYSGPIGAILTPQLINRKTASLLPYASTLCGACAAVCPVKIDHTKVLLALRKRYAEDKNWESSSSVIEKHIFTLYKAILEKRKVYEFVSWLLRLIQRPFVRKGKTIHLPGPLAYLTRSRNLSALGYKSFGQRWRELREKGQQEI